MKYREWSSPEVIKWLMTQINISNVDKKNEICNSFKENNITGDILKDLTLSDCKELCLQDSKLAINLKLSLNRLIEESGEIHEKDELVVVLNNLHTSLVDKLQEFQSQYIKLRSDILELVKRTTPHSQDYFEKPHQISNYISSPKLTSVPTKAIPTSLINNNISTAVPNSEPLKQLRASKEDCCEKILKNAMKRHNLNEADWKQYVLVICYGDQERILELNEKPVVIFKALKQQGLHPAIMLRQRGDFEEVDELTPGGRL